jgi:YD repeat-containing protein
VTQTDVTDPAGVEDSTSFDANGYSSSKTVGVGSSHPETTTTVYNPTTALLTSSTDPLGRLTTYGYCVGGELTGITQGSSHVTLGYSASGLPTSLTLPDGRVSSWRDARVAESGGLENRCTSCVPWVRIPLPPLFRA